MALTPPSFVETCDHQFLNTAHIVTLRYIPDDDAWLATTADHRTFHLPAQTGVDLTQERAV